MKKKSDNLEKAQESSSVGEADSRPCEASFTKRQREFARHALGLPNKKNMTYRNHFCIDAGGDGYEDWEGLVAAGMAVKAVGGANWCGDFFYLTLEGARAVLLPKEHISREEAETMRGRTSRTATTQCPTESPDPLGDSKVKPEKGSS